MHYRFVCGAIAAMFSTSGASAAVTFIEAFAQARALVTATGGEFIDEFPGGTISTLPTAAFGFAVSRTTTSPSASGSASASSYITFDDSASGTATLSGAASATSSRDSAAGAGFSENDINYTFASDRAFRVALTYEIQSETNTLLAPSLRFDVRDEDADKSVFVFRRALGGGSVSSTTLAAGTYSLRIRTDVAADAVSRSGVDVIPESLNGNVGFSIAAVPEPATWAMMMVGFGVVGAAARRRGRGLAAA